MDKIDFINRIIALYPHAIVDKKAQFDTYNRALPKDARIDYEDVYNLFCVEYKDTYPPASGKICEWANKSIKEEIKTAQKWINVKVYNPIYKCVTNSDCFPAGTSKEKMLATYRKIFPNTDGWKIIEVQ